MTDLLYCSHLMTNLLPAEETHVEVIMLIYYISLVYNGTTLEGDTQLPAGNKHVL